jgi:hypothetical protein
MKIPRLRFTVRRMMVIVAIAAIALMFAIPVVSRLLWLYKSPSSINLVGGAVEPDWIVLRTPAPVGRPVPVQCSYRASIAPSIPSGLIYKLSVEIQLIDATGTVLETCRQSHYLIARGKKGEEDWNELACTLTPRQPGSYMVRYDVQATDLFGRTGRVASHTGGFTTQ